MNNRGQFTIIAALLVAIVLAGTLIAVYATIRYDSSQSQTPQTLTATDETNSATSESFRLYCRLLRLNSPGNR